MGKIIVIHYDGIKKKFVFHQPGAGLKSIFVDFLIIENASFLYYQNVQILFVREENLCLH